MVPRDPTHRHLDPDGKSIDFATTQWSLVIAAGNEGNVQRTAALNRLCQTYWMPLYCYARRRVSDTHQAQDLTQAFFERLLEKNFAAEADPQRGRFRAFLITCFKHFLSKERDRAQTLKRGGGQKTNSFDFAFGDTSIAQHPSPGLTLPTHRHFGEYELIEEIARGGMGIVYKARQVRLNRIVAVKMVRAGQLVSDQDVERFFVEAEAAASLDHPGVVPIFEVGQADEQHYFSMAFVEGASLASVLQDGPLAPIDVAMLTRKVADAVTYAHSHGVIHRDLWLELASGCCDQKSDRNQFARYK